MTNTEAAWLAGIIDGEGSIYIRRSKKKITDNWTYALSVRVGMTHKPTIERIFELFPSSKIYSWNPTDKNKRTKKLFHWTLDTRKAEQLLKIVYPYLVTKKEQATLALAFCSIPKNARSMRTVKENYKQQLHRQKEISYE